MIFQENDIAYIVENNLHVSRVSVIRIAGGLCTVSFGKGKALRLPESRLYKTHEEAEKHVHRTVNTVKVEQTTENIIGDPHQWEYRNYR